jgi:hypothetical protein
MSKYLRRVGRKQLLLRETADFVDDVKRDIGNDGFSKRESTFASTKGIEVPGAE